MKIIIRASFEISATLEATEQVLCGVHVPSGTGYNPNTRLRNIQWECTHKYIAKKLVSAIMQHSPRTLSFGVEN
jgi:hypothetical protein